MEIRLDSLGLGKKGIVTRMDTNTHLKCRLHAFGMIPGTQISCRYRSPDGSVTALEFRGTVVAVRTRDMKKIWVEGQ